MHKREPLNKQVNTSKYTDCFKFTHTVLQCIKYNEQISNHFVFGVVQRERRSPRETVYRISTGSRHLHKSA